ncbi:MAG: diphthine synthase [Candidatus Woesearchaeota archaeon]
MVLYFVGLGLWDEKDISLKGLEIVRKCDKIFLDGYTSKLGVGVEKLEKLFGKKVEVANRELVESKAELILESAIKQQVAFLVVGDVFSATTHMDLYVRAKKLGVGVKVINNASVFSAVGVTGLQLYKFGKTTSIAANVESETAYNVIKDNSKIGLHTLVLLDLDVEKGKYMSVNEAITRLLKLEAKLKAKVFTAETKCVGCARFGSDDCVIKYGKAEELLKQDFGGPLHCLIVPGKLHFIEEEVLGFWELV